MTLRTTYIKFLGGGAHRFCSDKEVPWQEMSDSVQAEDDISEGAHVRRRTAGTAQDQRGLLAVRLWLSKGVELAQLALRGATAVADSIRFSFSCHCWVCLSVCVCVCVCVRVCITQKWFQCLLQSKQSVGINTVSLNTN